MDLGLKGKSVVITGGGSNIGRGIVLAFATEGAHITVGDLDEVQAERVSELARAGGAASVQVIKTDVTDLEQVKAMFKAATDKHGTVDVLVNNVGWDQFLFFTQTTPELWQKIIQINYVGLLNCTKCALDIMVPNNKGAIVAISSDASRSGEPREAVYGGVKAAVNSFMKTIAKENGRYGIRCNVVCPGVTVPTSTDEVGSTSMWAKADSFFSAEQFEKIAKSLPLRKLGRPEDTANAVVFLASSAAGHITGQVLSVSGGYTMIG
ncbi:MAG: SDR family oxidoreductase [Rhodopseudomonas sp.]|uniref:SDR family NAD(P)-dependent oxidoreductase n=1 Tax=Rhodopseudomonas sp. TaxID=1078 RepID=UPI001790DB39|nr:SDR family oxidoreductase [Rhodopseudomonas sp.]NVN86846.1 SDR family oxidoreductase [Rhodopseudomonas sp.]